VIGNSSYRNVAKLSNPANDAAAVAAMFKSAGFDTVESKLNLTVSELRKALRDFGNASRDADIAVVYYAGHGIELDGTNYLIRSMLRSRRTPMSSTRRCRWTVCCLRSNRPSNCGLSSWMRAGTTHSQRP